MKFVRDQRIIRTATSQTSTTPTIVPAVRDLVLGDVTTTEVDVKDRITVATKIALPSAFNDEATFEIPLNGHEKIFVTIHNEALGAGGLTGTSLVIEFKHPDRDNVWIPSKEGQNREAGAAFHEWALTGTGDFIVATREEPAHFKLARVRFRATAGTPDAATAIRAYWFQNGKVATVPDHGVRSGLVAAT